MKQGIHPEYVECTVKCSCGNTFTTRSTKPELKIDICNVCHPFYTGQQRFVDTGGRVQRFADKFGGAAAKVAEREAAKKAAEEAAKPVAWYRATAHAPSRADEAVIYSLSASGNTLTADAAFEEAASYEGLANAKAPQERKTYTFTLTKDTKCYSVGGESAPQQITIDQVVQAVSSQNGLGVIIEVRGDNVLEVLGKLGVCPRDLQTRALD